MKELLSKLGLNEKEISVYLGTLKAGPASSARIAMETNLPRQTVYSLILPLVERGFISKSVKRGVKEFFADPKQLLTLLDRQKEALTKNQALIEKELPKLLALRKKTAPLPKVEYYDGDDGLKNLFEHILTFYKKGGDKEFRGYGINQFHEVSLGGYLKEFVTERSKYNVKTRLLIGQGPDDFGIKDEATALNREVKRIAIDPQKAGIYLVGNQVYLFSYDDKTGVMIENKAIAKLITAIFDDHWKKYTD